MSARLASSSTPSDVSANDSLPFETTRTKVYKKRKGRRRRRGQKEKSAQNNNVHVVSAAIGSRRRKGDRSLFPSDAEIEQNAAFRKKICAPREDGVIRTEALRHHPSRGGSRGYSTEFKIMLIDYYDSGLEFDETLERSIQRWKKRLIAKKRTGNKKKTFIEGEHLFILTAYKRIFPHAKASQCALFISIHSTDGRVYTNPQIHNALKILDMTRKKGSTTAYQAFTPRNEYLYDCFISYNFPAGIRNVPRRFLMDGDECSFQVGDIGQSYGHAVKGLRVRKMGNYGRGASKIVVIMFIEPGDPSLDPTELGSIARPRIWYRVSKDKGTSSDAYESFLDNYVLNKMRPNEPMRYLMHDNLPSHKTDAVFARIHNAGHEVICRPPYRPHIAPIEFAFNMLACSLRDRWEQIKNEEQLIKAIHEIIDNRIGMGGFDELFQRCGYRYDSEEGL
jgi:transposase